MGHLSFTEILDTSLKVSWQEPLEKNGIITGKGLCGQKRQNKSAPHRGTDTAPGATAGSARVSRACRVTVTGPRWGKTCPGGLASCGPLLAGLQPPGVQARSPGRVEQASDISAQETRAPGVSSHSCFSSVISWPCRELTAEITAVLQLRRLGLGWAGRAERRHHDGVALPPPSPTPWPHPRERPGHACPLPQCQATWGGTAGEGRPGSRAPGCTSAASFSCSAVSGEQLTLVGLLMISFCRRGF